ncbi:hypothetical protein D3C76_1144910 [compost metagenome]
MQALFVARALRPALQLGQQRQAADILQQAGEQRVGGIRHAAAFGQRGAAGGAFQGGLPAGAEYPLEQRIGADEQVAQAEAQHQALQPARAQAGQHVAQRGARTDAAQQRAVGVLHEPGGQRRVGVDRPAQALQRGAWVLQQAAHAQQRLGHLRDPRFALEEAVVQGEAQGVGGQGRGGRFHSAFHVDKGTGLF